MPAASLVISVHPSKPLLASIWVASVVSRVLLYVLWEMADAFLSGLLGRDGFARTAKVRRAFRWIGDELFQGIGMCAFMGFFDVPLTADICLLILAVNVTLDLLFAGFKRLRKRG